MSTDGLPDELTDDERKDHDQFFKEMIQYNLADLVDLVLPGWRPRFVYEEVVWLQEELRPNPPKGEKQRIDLLCKLPTATSESQLPNPPEASLVHLHVEIEGRDPLAVFDERMCSYYWSLRQKGYQSILPLVVFFHVNLEGRGTRTVVDRLWEATPMQFQYHYLALPGLNAANYVQSDNWLGTAWSCVMNMPRDERPLASVTAMDRLCEAPLHEFNKRLLVDFVQSYGPVDDDQRRDLDALLRDPKRGGTTMFKKTVFQQERDKGRQEGWQEGLQEGRQVGLQEGRQETLRETAEYLLLDKFTAAQPEAIRQQLAVMTPTQLNTLLRQILAAKSLADLGLHD